MENFRAHANRVATGIGAHRHDHEFLNIDGIVGMFAAVDDVHHRRRQNMGEDSANIAIERQPRSAAAALATASETPRMALAPRRPLFSVPSNAIMVLSIRIWSSASSPKARRKSRHRRKRGLYPLSLPK